MNPGQWHSGQRAGHCCIPHRLPTWLPVQAVSCVRTCQAGCPTSRLLCATMAESVNTHASCSNTRTYCVAHTTMQPVGLPMDQQLCRCQRHPVLRPDASELRPGCSSHLAGRPFSAHLPERPGAGLQQQVVTVWQGLSGNALGELPARLACAAHWSRKCAQSLAGSLKQPHADSLYAWCSDMLNTGGW